MKNKSELWILAFAALVLILGIPGMHVYAKDSSQETESTQQKLNGWVTTSKGNKYYYVDGVKQKGWKKISGKYYYFSKKSGKMESNKIVGSLPPLK